MTPEQERILAIASARLRLQEQEAPTPAPAAPPTPEKAPGMLESFGRMTAGDTNVNLLMGGAKELGSTVFNLMKKYQSLNPNPQPASAPAGTVPMNRPAIQLGDKKPSFLEPSNTTQKIGGAGATMAEFAIPSAIAGKVPAAAKLGLGGKALLESMIAGDVGMARGETPGQVATDAATAGVLTGGVGIAKNLAGKLGERIETALLKPLSAELRQVKGPPEEATATMVKNVYKYGLGGDLQTSFKKATEKTADLSKSLRSELAVNPAAEVDLNQLLQDTAKELGANSTKNFGANSAIKKALLSMQDEIAAIAPNGKVKIDGAQDVKQAIGYMGAWNHGVRDADSTAMETVANSLYSKVRNAIETAPGQTGKIQDINRQLSEIIPIKNAILRRIPVAERREIISLKEFIGFATMDPKAIGMSLADRALRNGNVANAAVQFSKNPTTSGAPVTAASRALQEYSKRPQ